MKSNPLPLCAFLLLAFAATAVADPDPDKTRKRATPAPSQDLVAECTFVEIAASTTAKPSVAPELASLEKKLKKPPFSSWNTFKQLTRADKSIAQMRAETLKLQAGAVTVLFRDLAVGKKKRLALTVTMDDADGKRVMDTKISVDAGENFLVARALPNNDGHVLALSCRL